MALSDRPFVDMDPEREDLESARALAAMIAARRGVPLEELLGRGPKRRDTMGRKLHAAMAELATALKASPYWWSYPQVGRFVGRHHTTVMYAVGAIQRRKPARP